MAEEHKHSEDSHHHAESHEAHHHDEEHHKKEHSETHEPKHEHHESHETKSKETHSEKKHKTLKKPPVLTKNQIWILVGAAIVVFLIASYMTQGFGLLKKGSSTDEKVDFTLFVMSQCPYCKTAETAIAPILKDMGDNINFKMEFVANENADGTFRSLHGDNEVLGDLVWLCAEKYSEGYEYFDMIECMDQDTSKIPDNWEGCAQEASLDVENIRACYEGDEGKDLLRESIQVSKDKGVTGTPTIAINDMKYSGARTTPELKRAICNKFKERPESCSDIPEPAKVNLIVVNDKRCEECQEADRIVNQLEGIFPGLEVKTYDYSDDEGKAIYESTGVQYLPAFLFDDTVTKDDNYMQVQKYLNEAGDYLSLRVGATFDPSAEICNNGIDDTGDGVVDCEDETCKEKMECRQEIKKKLDLFVMSQCPYGVRAMDAMKDVLDQSKTSSGYDMDFDLYYIANDNGDGTFDSLHGQGEVDEDLRDVCVIKNYPDNYKYMDYIWCQNEVYNSKGDMSKTWEKCLTDNGMDAELIKKCSEGDEGKALLAENVKLGNGLEVGASPTWLANNRYEFSGIDSDTVKESFCEYNENAKICG